MVIFILVTAVVGMLTYDNIYSVIPVIIGILIAYSTWQKNTSVIRVIYLVTTIGFIIYNFMVFAYVPLIGNIVELSSAIVAIYRFDIKKQKKPSIV